MRYIIQHNSTGFFFTGYDSQGNCKWHPVHASLLQQEVLAHEWDIIDRITNGQITRLDITLSVPVRGYADGVS